MHRVNIPWVFSLCKKTTIDRIICQKVIEVNKIIFPYWERPDGEKGNYAFLERKGKKTLDKFPKWDILFTRSKKHFF
jgi:hypothetical protein